MTETEERQKIRDALCNLDIWQLTYGVLAFCKLEEPGDKKGEVRSVPVTNKRLTYFYDALSEDFPQLRAKVLITPGIERKCSDLEGGLQYRLRDLASLGSLEGAYKLTPDKQEMLAAQLENAGLMPNYQWELEWLAKKFDATRV